MRWSRAIEQPLLNVRTAMLNGTLEDAFCRRCYGLRPADGGQAPREAGGYTGALMS